MLCEFGGTEAASRIAYRRYVQAGLAQPPANPLADAVEGVLLGSETFIAANRHLIEAAESDIARICHTTTIEEAIAAVAVSFQVSVDDIQQPGRHGNLARETAIWLCRLAVRVPLNELATVFGGISASTVTDTVRRCEARQKRSAEFRAQCEILKSRGYPTQRPSPWAGHRTPIGCGRERGSQRRPA